MRRLQLQPQLIHASLVPYPEAHAATTMLPRRTLERIIGMRKRSQAWSGLSSTPLNQRPDISDVVQGLPRANTTREPSYYHLRPEHQNTQQF
jgi:hypothetical protein